MRQGDKETRSVKSLALSLKQGLLHRRQRLCVVEGDLTELSRKTLLELGAWAVRRLPGAETVSQGGCRKCLGGLTTSNIHQGGKNKCGGPTTFCETLMIPT